MKVNNSYYPGIHPYIDWEVCTRNQEYVVYNSDDLLVTGGSHYHSLGLHLLNLSHLPGRK